MSRECPTGGGDKCFNCKEEGHKSRDCPQPQKPRGGRVFAKDKPVKGGPEEGGRVKNRFDSSVCYKCGKTGHRSHGCPSGIADICFNCKKEGHKSRDCPEPSMRTCHNCNEVGHMSKDCTAPQKASEGGYGGRRKGPLTCFHCNSIEHIKRNCPTAPKLKCYVCKGVGHIGKECTKFISGTNSKPVDKKNSKTYLLKELEGNFL